MCGNIPKEPRDFGMVAKLTATFQCPSSGIILFSFGPSARKSRSQPSRTEVNFITLLGVTSLTAT